jgi:two-component system, chemotaxis family, response regulator Rcp1
VLDYLDVDHLLDGQYALTGTAGTRPVEILIVEDNPADLILTKTALRDAGIVHEVSVVRDGERALARLRRQGRYVGANRPDVVLLDINLPRVNGYQVLEQMRADPDLKHIPVIVLSGNAVQEDMKRSDHATTYLVKPIRLKEYLSIAQAIKEVCDLVEAN